MKGRWSTILGLIALCSITDVRGELDLARAQPEDLDDCAALAREHAEELASYQCFWLVGRRTGRSNEAARRLEALQAIRPQDPRIQLYLGLTLADLQREGAEALMREAVDGFVEEGHVQGEFWARESLGIYHYFRHDQGLARRHLERSLELALRHELPLAEAEARIWLGWVDYRTGDYAAAWSHFEQAEARIVPDGPVLLQKRLLDGLGSVCWALGRYRAGLEYQERALALVEGTDPAGEAHLLQNMLHSAQGLAAAGELPEASVRELAERALASARRAGHVRAEIGARLALANLSDPQQAVASAREALALAREEGERGFVLWSLLLLADNLNIVEPGSDEAFAHVQEAIELSRRWGQPIHATRAAVVRSVMHWIAGREDQAISAGHASLEAIERLRELQPEGELQARVFGRWAYVYRRLAGWLLQGSGGSSDGVERALPVMERLRARSLLETLDAAEVDRPAAPSNPAVEERERVLQRITEIQRELFEAELTKAQRDNLVGRLEQLEATELALRREVSRDDPVYAAAAGRKLAHPSDLQQALERGEAMISYQISEAHRGGSWAVVLTRDRTIAVELPELPAIADELDMFLALLQRRDGAAASGAARLYEKILEKPLAELPPSVTRLVVVPDGALYRLPFAALRPDADADPLVSRYQLCVVPSATAWWRWRLADPGEADSPLLALADPDVSMSETEAFHREAGIFSSRIELGRLPQARSEAWALRRLFGRSARVLAGAEATEAVIKSTELRTYQIVHLAAHAIVDDQHPERSAVVLAPGSSSEDGLLQYREIVDLDLEGRVVILSACRSGSGPLIGGEGVMGLAQAFFQAGAHGVVAALWPLRDDEARALMVPMAAALAEGETLAAALAQAQRGTMEGGMPAAAWSGFVVLGDGGVAPFPGGRPSSGWLGWLLVGIVALSIVGYGILRWKRSS